MTVGARLPMKITFQAADVHKALLSTTIVADADCHCFLGRQ